MKRSRFFNRNALISSIALAGRCALLAVILCGVFIPHSFLYSQIQDDSSSVRTTGPLRITAPDSAALPLTPVTSDISFDTKSPALAIGLSALLPGAGQVYAERYWSIPIIWGFGIWLGVNFKEANDLYLQYRDDYNSSIGTPEFGDQGDPQALALRDFYRNERDRFGAFLLLTYILNLVDAYIGATLYGFDVSEDLSGSANLRLNLRIPFR